MRFRDIPTPIAGGAYRYANGQLIRDDAVAASSSLLPPGEGARRADEGTPSQAAEPVSENGTAEPNDPQPRARGRRNRED